FDVDLGVAQDVRSSQAGWDHGAFEIAEQLGEALGPPVHAGAFTRMFVDLNRPADHADVIPRNSYGAIVPGNAHLSPGDRAALRADFAGQRYAGIELETSHAVTFTPGGCTRIAKAVLPFLERL